MRSTVAIAAAAASLSVCFALSIRQLRLSWISRTRQPLYVALGFGLVGASSLVWVAQAPFTAGFWLAHAFDIAGVFMLTIGAVVAYRQRPTLREMLRPLVVNTPLSAFELGLEPLVHRFVRSLEAKDQITRDHVVRAAELAIHVGTQLRLPAHEVHTLGLGALLHDIGKLSIPTEILNKSGRLTASEYEIVQRHTAAGEAMARESGVLAPIAPILRSHHERIDGGGYPDGLEGADIPLLARVVSVCDAFDAMANTRQYREGMGADRALAILREHSGSQWDSAVVEAFATALARWQPTFSTLANVGRGEAAAEGEIDDWCSCVDALPAGLVAAGQSAYS